MIAGLIEFAILIAVLVAVWLLLQWAFGYFGVPITQPLNIVLGLVFVLIILYALLGLLGIGGVPRMGILR